VAVLVGMTKTTDNNREGDIPFGSGAAVTEPEFDAWFVREVLPLEAALMQYLSCNWRDKAEIEDICQDVFVKIHEAARYDQPRAVKPFAFAIARNLIVDRLRHAQVIPIETAIDLDALGIATDDPGPERTVMARDELKRLQATLERLPRRCRQAVTLRKIEGLSMREIAERMGISVKTVDAHLVEGASLLANFLYGESNAGRKP
jgi:RNA polymerase sigma factor (sigma-70 family)